MDHVVQRAIDFGFDPIKAIQMATLNPAAHFAMDHVVTLPAVYRPNAGDWSETWNGRNARGDIVANGVYIYHLEKSGQGSHWGKIMILD